MEGPGRRQYYFIGKDNIPFHTIIWPAILIGRGDTDPAVRRARQRVHELRRPEGVQERAASATTVPDLLERFDPDAIRYYLIANAPENARHRLHRGRVHPPQQRRAGRDLGQPGPPHADLPAALLRGQVPGDGTHRSRVVEPRSSRPSRRSTAQLDSGPLQGDHRRRDGAGPRSATASSTSRRPGGRSRRTARRPARRIGSLLNLINAPQGAVRAVPAAHLGAPARRCSGTRTAWRSHGWQLGAAPGGQALPKPAPLFVKIDTSTARRGRDPHAPRAGAGRRSSVLLVA